MDPVSVLAATPPPLLSSKVSKTGDTVQNRNSSTKKYFCIFGFRSIKYKKSDPVYHSGPDRERKKNPKTGGSRPRFETLAGLDHNGRRKMHGAIIIGARLRRPG